MLITGFVIRKKEFPKSEITYSASDIVRILIRFIVAIMLPAIMVGGIVSGVFTPTESGCAAVFYALFVGFIVTRELTFKKVYQALVKTSIISGVVFLIISVSTVTTWWLTIQKVPDQIVLFIQGFVTGKGVFLLLMVGLLLFMGLFFEVGAGIVLLAPMLVPLSESFGVNPIQFGLMTCLGLLIGVVTPPVGICLYLSSSIAETQPEKVFRAALPLLALEGSVLLLITFFPETYLWVPQLFGYSV
jgi:tripartite ATP-independent transporter DctM subunit